MKNMDEKVKSHDAVGDGDKVALHSSSGVGTPKVHDCGFEERRQNQAKIAAGAQEMIYM